MVLALPSSEGPAVAVEGRDGLCRTGDEAQSWRPSDYFWFQYRKNWEAPEYRNFSYKSEWR